MNDPALSTGEAPSCKCLTCPNGEKKANTVLINFATTQWSNKLEAGKR